MFYTSNKINFPGVKKGRIKLIICLVTVLSVIFLVVTLYCWHRQRQPEKVSVFHIRICDIQLKF